MSKRVTTLEAMEQEIAGLEKSEYVKLGEKEQQVKMDKRRKRLYQPRWLEKRGKALAAAGATLENIRAFVEAAEAVEE